MTEGLPGFNAEESARARDEGMERVDGGAPPDWKFVARQVIEALAKSSPFVHADDVWAELLRESVGEPPEPRALGPVMKSAQSAGIIAPTETYRLSARVTAHRNPKRLWRSLIYDGSPMEPPMPTAPDPNPPPDRRPAVTVSPHPRTMVDEAPAPAVATPTTDAAWYCGKCGGPPQTEVHESFGGYGDAHCKACGKRMVFRQRKPSA